MGAHLVDLASCWLVRASGRKLRLMTLIDELTRECLAIRVARRINSFGVIEAMADVMLAKGPGARPVR